MSSVSGIDTGDAIAVVGMSGRFPGARTPSELWRNLKAGVESIRRLNADELERAKVPETFLNDPAFVPASADLSQIELFDPAFFGMTVAEASATDPQLRLLLELGWEVLEDSGHVPESFAGAIGVFVGNGHNDYLYRVLEDGRYVEALGAFAVQIANRADFAATRLAYAFNLTGPAVSVQTACSTSLVAVHLACQSLLSGECDLALSGGVSIQLPQARGYLYQEGGVASPDGHCRTFDARARGTLVGNGGGMVALRRLEDALADEDAIHAVLRATAINNDGARKVGFTAPSVEGQAAVIEEALSMAGVHPREVGYVEAHGTATPLGDPIEIKALDTAFRTCGWKEGDPTCKIGSVKSNLGHLDAGAGITGLIKAVCAVRFGEIPASLHFETPNPALEIERTPFRVVQELAPWRSMDERRVAGVSSFGIGGTNAHVVLEQPPTREPDEAPDIEQLFVFSARTPESLVETVSRIRDHFAEDEGTSMAEAAWTLQIGRRSFTHRMAVCAEDRDDLLVRLDQARERPFVAGPRELAFLFPGQGSQVFGMGRQLYERESIFRETLRRCAGFLKEHTGIDLLEELYGEGKSSALDQTRVTQPALFAVECALARQWMSWGIEPSAMLGHSLGEYVAAHLAGVFTLEDGLRLVSERARLMQSMEEGSMIAVALPEDALRRRLSEELCIASINSPSSCVASGPSPAVHRLMKGLEAERVACRLLRTSHAFHSSMMDPMLDEFRQVVSRVELREPERRYLSNLTGTWVQPAAAIDPEAWVQQLRSPVRLADGLSRLSGSNWTLLTVGPGTSFGAQAIASLPRREQLSDWRFLKQALGDLWARGVEVDLSVLHPTRPKRVSLPTTAYERQWCWVGEVEESTPPDPGCEPLSKGTTEEWIGELWARALGLARVGPEEDVYDLGASSLIAVQVLAQLKARAPHLQLADLQQAATPRELAARMSAGASANGLVTELNGSTDTEGPVLVCVHGIDGEVAAFTSLARHLSRPTFALQAPEEIPQETVEGLARLYVDALCAKQAQGPYELAGHSFGGLVALEMGRELLARGAEVTRVVVIDSWMHAADDERPSGAELEEQGRELLERSGWSRVLGQDEIESRMQRFHRLAEAALSYHPDGYPGQVLLIVAADQDDPPRSELIARWRERIGQELRVRTASGGHFSMLADPHAKTLAEILSRMEA